MKRIRRSIIWTGVGILVGILISVVIRFAFRPAATTTITSTVLKNSLVQAQDLTTTKYSYAKVGKYTNSLDINGWNIPFTQKNFLLTYQGEVDLGIDMSKVDVSLRGSVIKVHCPAVQIFSNTIDEKKIEIYDESMNLLNPTRISDYLEFAIQQKAKAIEEMQQQDVFEQAQRDAKNAIEQLLRMIPEVSEKYSIEVTFDPMPDYMQDYLKDLSEEQKQSLLKDQEKDKEEKSQNSDSSSSTSDNSDQSS